MIDLRSAARALGGEVSGRQVLFPPPGHSHRDRSAAVRFDVSAPGGFVVHSFAGDDPISIRDHVRGRLGLVDEPRIDQHSPNLGSAAVDDAERTARALAIWREAEVSHSSLLAYLERRGVELPAGALGEAIRFHPTCPFAGKRHPCMVALVRDVVTDAPKAIHRTAITITGDKVKIDGKDRLALGPIGGGAVKLTPDADVTLCLGVGEGIETTLSMQRLPEFGGSPVWALLNAGNVEAFPVLSGIESLWVAVDHDLTGLRASQTCAARWQAAGREVFLLKPNRAGADLNDLPLFGREASHA